MKTIRFLHAFYSRYISPMLGNVCRFHPSCSHYAVEALERHGFVAGGCLSIRRLFKCHPWCEGGFDPVPQNNRRENS